MNGNIESGMEFVEQPGDYFKIETCPTMKALGVKTCDFVITRKLGARTKVFIIEAKSSAPRPPENDNTYKESWEEFLQTIYEKMVNTLLVFVGLKTGRHYSRDSDLPLSIKQASLSDLAITPCLVLREHPEQVLPQVSDALRIKMQPIVKSFVLEQPIVVNADMAIRKGLVNKTIS